MKKGICALLTIVMFLSFITVSQAASLNNKSENTVADSLDLDVKSAILMEAGTGKIIYAQNENQKSEPASVTKVMTLLLVMEAIEDERISIEDNVIISEYAASMGGSQVFLEEGEAMKVQELIKCAVIASANDAAVALAEHVGGSEKLFVAMMNKRASELGMKNTNFENVTGLDDTTANHMSSANDIAIMSRELIKYDIIRKFGSMWQDSIRNGEFTLTNTNRLVRYYDGCNGLKTGSTDKAGYCISATAERNGLQLIAVIMGAETRDKRNAAAKELLDYGFANYGIYSMDERKLENVPVYNGTKDYVSVYTAPFSCVVPKSEIKKVEMKFEIPENLTAPIKEGDIVGKITYLLNGEEIGTSEIYVTDNIDKMTVWDVFSRIFCNIFGI